MKDFGSCLQWPIIFLYTSSIILEHVYSFSFLGTSSCSTCNFFTRVNHQARNNGSNHNENLLCMRISKGKSKQSKSNSLYAINQTRKRLAGKPGSKHYMDPNKVFIGNLPFTATVSDVEEFLKLNLGGLQHVESVKIISDWKTGKSKGYGFIQFMEPIFATSAMELIKGKKVMGRVIRLDQGKKKDDDEKRVLFVKKRERKGNNVVVDSETEEGVIDSALDEVEGMADGNIRNGEVYDENDESELKVFKMGDFDDQNDSLIFGNDEIDYNDEEFFDDDYEEEDDDDDDDEVDGWFEDFYGGSKWEELSEDEAKTMNRAQRREAQRMKPKKKLPRKGFGDYIPKTPPPEI